MNGSAFIAGIFLFEIWCIAKALRHMARIRARRPDMRPLLKGVTIAMLCVCGVADIALLVVALEIR